MSLFCIIKILGEKMNKKNRRPTARPATVAAPTEFNPDYTQVKKDLTRILVLAVAFFGLLIALSFIIK
jgi:hypothetical protein